MNQPHRYCDKLAVNRQWKRRATWLLFCCSLAARAEVTLDGSMGPSGALSGPAYLIPDTFGQTRGANLFHSFSGFNLTSSESATFTGPAAINHVISRVSGGNPSAIDGLLRSTIPSADLWFINPAGVVFGQNASLDVDGGFHISTADYLKLGGGGKFAATNPNTSILTSAPPEAFGFLGPSPAPIQINSSTLRVPDGETFSLVGGDISISGGTLEAPGGRFNLVSVGSAGEAVLAVVDVAVSSFTAMGEMSLTHNALVDGSGDGGGAIYIRSGRLYMNESNIFADTLGSKDGQGVSVETHTLEMRAGSALTADTLGEGRGGNLKVVADDIFLASDNAPFVTSLAARAGGKGAAGSVTIVAANLEVHDGASIDTSTYDEGDGGDLRIEAGSILLSRDASPEFTGLIAQAQPDSVGDAGALTIIAQSLEVSGGAQISSATVAQGNGGELSVNVAHIALVGSDFLSGTRSGIFASTGGNDSGDAGRLSVVAETLEIRDGARISVSTFGSGDAGDMSVDADHILLSGFMLPWSGTLPGEPAGLLAIVGSGGTGDAGSMKVTAKSLEVYGGAQISAKNSGPGKSGNIQVDSDRIILAGDNGLGLRSGIYISAGSTAVVGGGSLSVITEDLEISGGAQINGDTSGSGRGGDVHVNAGSLLITGVSSTGSRSGIYTISATGSKGDAGSIVIEAEDLEVHDGGQIVSTTGGSGKGGNVSVEATNVLLSGVSRTFLGFTGINASTSGTGAAGTLTVAAENLVVRDGAEISASTFSKGRGGDVKIVAGTILLSGVGVGIVRSGIYVSTNKLSTGNAGSLTVVADSVKVQDGAQISVATSGTGDGGALRVEASAIVLDGIDAATGFGSRIVAVADAASSGKAGSLDIAAQNLEVLDGAEITASSFGTGRGGDVQVNADRILLSGVSETGLRSGIYASAAGEHSGDAGSVEITAVDLELRDGAQISTSTAGSGVAGNIAIGTGSLTMLDGSAISSDSSGSGLAGNIVIDAGQRLEIRDSEISSQAQFSDGGNIKLTTDDLVLVVDGEITTSVGTGLGQGGNINIDPQFVILLRSQVIANAFGGPGGTVTITADNFLSSDSVVEAVSKEAGINGTVTINSPDADVSGSLTLPPQSFLNAEALLAQRCGVQTRSERSSLVMTGRGGLPAQPDGFLIAEATQVLNASRLLGGNAAGRVDNSRHPVVAEIAPASKPVSGCL